MLAADELELERRRALIKEHEESLNETTLLAWLYLNG